MQLYSFLVLIVSLGCGSLPPTDATLWQAAIATSGLVTGWTILCHVAARICAIQVIDHRLDPLVGADLLEKQMAIFRWLGLGATLFCLAGFGLAGAISNIPIVESSVFLQALLLLIPGILLTAATWSAEHLYGVLMGYTQRGFRCYANSMQLIFRSGIGWLLIPVLMLLALNDAVAALPISDTVAGVTTGIAILLLIVAGVPIMIHRLFKTSKLQTTNANWIADILAAAGVARTRAVRWETGNQSYNALVAGFVPPLRTLLISDRLIDQLPRNQVAMVVLHEAAHLRRRHMPLRMLAILPAWASGLIITRLAGEHPWAMAGGTLFGILMTLLLLKVVAYRTEHDADVQACRMAERIAGRIADVPASYDEAADALSAGLWRVTADQPKSRKPTWLHPGVAERVAWMHRFRKASITRDNFAVNRQDNISGSATEPEIAGTTPSPIHA